MVFVASVGDEKDLREELELRNERFEIVPLTSVPDIYESVMIKYPEDNKWQEMSFKNLKKLAHETMTTSLIGLRGLSHQS
jgi:hypothetical protein